MNRVSSRGGDVRFLEEILRQLEAGWLVDYEDFTALGEAAAELGERLAASGLELVEVDGIGYRAESPAAS